MTPGSKPAALDENGILKCPKCDQTYLHHGEVAVFDRGEDDPTVTVTRVRFGSVMSAKAQNHRVENPSPRRGGIKIAFECESCDNAGSKQHLNIVQHKGETFLFWDAW